eukprot:162529-Rhodomonas_salina.3
MSSYVPTGMLEGLSKNILAAGTSYEEGAEGKKSGASADAPPPAFPRPPTEEEKGAEKERKAAAAAAASPDLTVVGMRRFGCGPCLYGPVSIGFALSCCMPRGFLNDIMCDDSRST